MSDFSALQSEAYTDPRIERTRRVVFNAACDLVSEQGIGRVTVEGIAERCGVARSTIYRHWPTLEELLLDALRTRVKAEQTPDTGDIRTDLLAALGQLAAALQSSTLGPLIAALIAESVRDPELGALCTSFTAGRRQRVEGIIERSRDQGELPPDTDIAQMAEDLAAAVFFRSLILRQPVGGDFVADTVDRRLANPPRL